VRGMPADGVRDRGREMAVLMTTVMMVPAVVIVMADDGHVCADHDDDHDNDDDYDDYGDDDGDGDNDDENDDEDAGDDNDDDDDDDGDGDPCDEK
jgi:hypothetical protein